MEVYVEEISPAKRKLEVKVPKEEVNAEINNLYQDMRKRARLKGFRPGKVPMYIIKSLYKNQVIATAIHNLIEKTYPEALKKAQLRPIKEREIEPGALKEDEEFEYIVTLEVIPEFELPPYKGIEVEVSPIEVTEKEVEAEINRLREMHSELKTIEEPRPLKAGDYVILDFQGYQDGKPLENFKAENYMAELGKGQLHENIEKELIGAKVGEEKIVKLQYPEDFQNKELAGKEIELHLTIKEAKEKVLPELDEEFLKTLGEYETVEDLKKAIYQQIKEKKELVRDEYVKNYILAQLTEKTEIDLPESLVEEELEDMLNRAFQFTTPEVRKSLDLEKYKKELRPTAEQKVKAKLILGKIAKVENITAEKDEIEEELKLMAENLKVPIEQMRVPYVISRIESRIIGEKVLAFLKEKAEIKEVEEKEETKEEEAKETEEKKE